MKQISRIVAAIVLAATLAGGIATWGQAGGAGKEPSAALAQAKNRIHGYTRIHPKTGQPVQVRPYKRRPPQPKPIEVKSYERGGRPVTGHSRRKPGNPVSPSARPH